MLSQRDIDRLAGIIGADFKQKWEGIIKKTSQAGKVTVANTGLYSSGKSSLFNAVLGRVADENIRFPIGVIPTTKTGDREILSGNVELLDTPGIDANLADDAVAFDMLMQSDIILMTHNVKRGMLDRPEYEWLKRIAGSIDSSLLGDRLLFILTWIDEIHDASDMQKLRDEIHKQVSKVVNGADIQFVEVSAKRYKTGIEKDKKALEDASGIPGLRELILTRAGKFAEKARALRQRELLKLCRESKSMLSSKKINLDDEITAKKRRVSDRYSGAFEKWRGILSRFSGMRSGVSSKLQEIYDAYDDVSEYQNFKNWIYSK